MTRHHRPLHAFRHPRSFADGKSPYIFRREAGAEVGFGPAVGTRKFPTLYLTEKVRDKAGAVFLNCPHFEKLRDCDLDNNGSTNSKKYGLDSDELKDFTNKGRLSLKTLNKKHEKMSEKDKIYKEKRKKKRDPSIKAIREHLKKIVKYHEKKVVESIPSIYPMLGAANTDSDNTDSETESVNKRKKVHGEVKMKGF